MNTFRATSILPCAGTSGGVPAQPSAAGRPIVVDRRRSTPFKHAGGNSPILWSDAFSSVRGGLGIVGTNPGQPAPIFSLGLGRALQPLQKPARAFANALHLPTPFQSASASYEQEIIGAAHELGSMDQERGFFSQGGTDG